MTLRIMQESTPLDLKGQDSRLSGKVKQVKAEVRGRAGSRHELIRGVIDIDIIGVGSPEVTPPTDFSAGLRALPTVTATTEFQSWAMSRS